MTIPGYVPGIGERDLDKIVRAVRNLYEGGATQSDLTEAEASLTSLANRIASLENGGAPIQPALWPVSAYKWGVQIVPLLSKNLNAAWDFYSTYSPVIVRNLDGTPYQDGDGWYYFYYVGTDDSTDEDDETGLAKTRDFRQAFRVSASPILALGSSGQPDEGDAQVGCALFDGTTFHVWYSGNEQAPGAGPDLVQTCYATGTSLTSLTKQGVVVSYGLNNTYDDFLDIYKPVVCRAPDNSYKMIATGHNNSNQFGAMLYESATINGTWTRASNNYVFRPSADTYTSDFWYEQDLYHMLYGKIDPESSSFETWYANSPDAETWAERRRVVSVGLGGPWNPGGGYNAMQVVVDDQKIILFGANAYDQGGGVGIISVPTGGDAPTVTCSQNSYTNAEPIVISFTGAPVAGGSGNGQSAWIGVYPAAGGALVEFLWTDDTSSGSGLQGIPSGTVTFPADTFDPGDYEARLNFDGVEITSDTFTVSN